MAKQKVGALHVELSIDGKAYRAELTKADKRTKAFSMSASKSFRAASGSVIALTAAATAAAASLALMYKRSGAEIDKLAKSSDKLGIATEALVGLRHAAEQTAGVTGGTLDTAIQRMVRRVSEAAVGTGSAKKALEELGLSARDLAMLAPERQFSAIADAMAGASTQGDKVRLSMALFDTEGVALVNTLQAGSAGLKDYADEAERLGIAVNRTDAASIEAANDALDKMGKAATGVQNTIAIALAPSLQAAAEAGVELAASFKPTGDEMEMLGKTAAAVFGTMLDGVQLIIMGFHGASVAVQGFRVLMSELAKESNNSAVLNAAGYVMPGLSDARKMLAGFEMSNDDTIAAIITGEKSMSAFEKQRKEWASETLEYRLAQIAAERKARQEAAEEGGGAGAGGVSVDPTIVSRLAALRAASLTEVEIAERTKNQTLETLKAALDSGLMAEDEYYAMRIGALQAFSDARDSARVKEMDADKARALQLQAMFATEEQMAIASARERVAAAREAVELGIYSQQWLSDETLRIQKELDESLKEMRQGGEEGDDPLAAEAQRMTDRLAMLQQFGIMEIEQANILHQQKLMAIEEQLGQRNGLEAEYNAALEAENARHKRQMASIENMGNQMRVAAFTDSAGQILSGFQSLGNVLLKDTKAFNIGMAIANTALGVTKQLSLGNWPAAFATAAAGVGQVAAIQKAGKGSGSVASVRGGGSAGSAQSAPPPPTVTNTQQISIEVRRASGSVSREEAVSLYEALTDVARDRNDGARVMMS